MKNKGGRPPIPSVYTEEKLNELADSLYDWVSKCHEEDEFKLLSEWAFENNFCHTNFKRYTAKNENFRLAYERAKSYQEQTIAKGGLTKKFESRFCTFFLGCQHGWRSKDDADQQKRDLRNDFVKFIEKIKDEDDEDDE